MVQPTSRRRALQLAGGTLFGGLAGCSQLTGSSGNARLGDITFVNDTGSPRTAILSMERNGEEVFGAAYDIPASDESTTVVEGGWPTEPGRYTIAVATDSHPRPETVELTEGGCLRFIVEINDSWISFFGPAAQDEACEP